MRRRVLAGVAAVLLAAVGAVLLLSYVSGADQRAMAGLQTVRVLVVTKAIPAGTPATQISGDVTSKLLPAVAVAPGTVTDVGTLADKVATADLQPGEQLLARRFAAASARPGAGGVKIPAGMQEMSIALDAQRVLGGHLVPGARVGLFVSLPKDGDEPAVTVLLLQRVLVSQVQGGSAAPSGSTSTPSSGSSGALSSAGSASSSGQVMVTFVLSSASAEKVVFGAENGAIWLSLQPTTPGAHSAGVTAKDLDR